MTVTLRDRLMSGAGDTGGGDSGTSPSASDVPPGPRPDASTSGMLAMAMMKGVDPYRRAVVI